MPRRRADKVIEHRVSLSDGLHKEVKAVIKTNKQQSQIAMVGNGAKATLNVVAVGGVAAVAYLGVKAYAEAKGVFPAVKQSFQDAWDWSFGVKTNADGSVVPTTVNAVDADGNPIVVTNPIYKVPLLNRVPGIGGLFDWGMKLGATNNPFEDNPAAASVIDKLTDIDMGGSGRPTSDWGGTQEEWEDYVYNSPHAVAGRERAARELEEKRRRQEAANIRLGEIMRSAEGSGQIGTSFAAGLEAQFREDYGDDFVDELLAADPNYFVPDFTVDVGPITGPSAPTGGGSSPFDPAGPMNWMSWGLFVSGKRYTDPTRNYVHVDGHTANLNHVYTEYLAHYNLIMGANWQMTNTGELVNQ